MALSRNVYTSALLTAGHNFTQKIHFYCGNITGYNQRYLGLYIKFQIFLFIDFDQVWIFSTDFS